jgi:hypothetical protein
MRFAPPGADACRIEPERLALQGPRASLWPGTGSAVTRKPSVNLSRGWLRPRSRGCLARKQGRSAEFAEQVRRRLAQRIDVAPVQAHHLDPARRRRVDDGGMEAVTPTSSFARTPARTKLSRTRLRTAPERSRVHPFAFAPLGMAVSERLCWRPIQARAISQTAFEAWGRPSISRARARGGSRGVRTAERRRESERVRDS